MSPSDFWYLRPGLILPNSAVMAVLRLEQAGHRLRLDGDGENIRIDCAQGVPLLDDDVEMLRRWKQHAILLLTFTASDRAADNPVLRADSSHTAVSQ